MRPGQARRTLWRLAARWTPRWLRDLYPTPKVDVRAAVFRDEGILLVREVSDGSWALPGGWVNRQESLGKAAAREVEEEAGMATRPVKVLAVANVTHDQVGRRLRVNIFRVFVRCELTSDRNVPIRGFETTEARFYEQRDLPELSTGRCTREQVDLMFAHYADPLRTTDFE